MGALFYKTPITVKGIIGMMLVVIRSFPIIVQSAAYTG